MIATFTLIKGGDRPSDYAVFEAGRECLRAALLPLTPQLQHTDFAFHEDNVPVEQQRQLVQRMCAAPSPMHHITTSL